MKLQLPDMLILVSYLLAMLIVGWILRKKARQNNTSYLLGGKSLPWYLLGLSDASDMFDISGTMWMVSLCFIYGMKSIWIPWLWPVFNQIFMMMYLSKWMRRSNASTGAEWLATRFGSDQRWARSAHLTVVAFALLGCLGFLAYGFVGLGKFMEVFIPWSSVSPYIPFAVPPAFVPHLYGVAFTLFATFYAVLGGMHSIVIGDLIKYIILTAACVAVAIIAVGQLHGNRLPVPDGWTNPFFGRRLNLDWSALIEGANKKIAEDGFSVFGFFFMMMLFKGVFASLAGPAPNYDMQKILSTRSPMEASKMTGFVSIVLLPVRYALIIGLTVMALLGFRQLDLSGPGGGIDFEKILPAASIQFLPVGVLGLLFTGLLGAFISTFSGTLNAAQAYIINDIYLKYINPKATNRQIMIRNYAIGTGVVLFSIGLGLLIRNINSILQWIVAALYGGYIAANVLKWYWWRFNACGFFWGMATGILAALVFPLFFHGLPLYNWPLLFLLSLLGSIAGTYASPPTDSDTLCRFYRTVKPWGFWKPVRDIVQREDPGFVANQRFGLDMFNVVLGVIAQCCLTILPMYAVLWMKLPLMVTVIILSIVAFILKKTWWNKLEN